MSESEWILNRYLLEDELMYNIMFKTSVSKGEHSWVLGIGCMKVYQPLKVSIFLSVQPGYYCYLPLWMVVRIKKDNVTVSGRY